ncbi:hypothetical protein AGMMS49587_20220 [Spirochaetia bacterium]|nr:hypothetical protein AGMMS49587_20220 [Spirochaetia bacterium]
MTRKEEEDYIRKGHEISKGGKNFSSCIEKVGCVWVVSKAMITNSGNLFHRIKNYEDVDEGTKQFYSFLDDFEEP